MKLSSINLLAILGLLWLGACSEDDNEDDLDVQGSNTTLTVFGEVEGDFEARGQYIEHSDAVSGLHVNSFEFLDNFDPSQSTFLISISRFSEDPMELGTGLHRLETSYMVGGETGKFGAGVTWWDESRNAIIYPELTNGILRVNKITDSHIQGDIILRMKTSEYNEVQTEINIDGSFNVPE
ncbi:hypothetical protein [Geofilum rubicundum]|uniref:Uncharacterized protein n=1 Tax=Geofilum rubicundum JCM 15548 TaxID=1236989 RepID=A0A0E9M2X9_9BACT|nr:hypothetical protein [Geofilum rubicundum]GAO31510.1 hypothetical protein JCM15548_13877 [Geofilum rubicundum JCM 15548]